MLTSDSLSALPGIRHGFFTREGGVSEGLYASLNCGLGSGDNLDSIAENRTRSDAVAEDIREIKASLLRIEERQKE